MSYSFDPPTLTAAQESHADWLELRALQARSRTVSIREYIRDLGIAGTADGVNGEEPSSFDFNDDVMCEQKAEDAFAEIDDRVRACSGSYPFEILDENVLQIRPGREKCVYSFMALLSRFGKDAGPPGLGGAQLFEDLCARAMETYLGGGPSRPSHDTASVASVRACVFGFPRRVLPAGFADALDQLCADLGEGSPHKGRQNLPRKKDDKLDIVAWKEFGDRRPGKLIAFGQCATGRKWREKISELPQPHKWCQNWMRELPAVDPVRSFFVPHRVEFNEWIETCLYGGLLFDRCRIAQLTIGIDKRLASDLNKWTRHVLAALRSQ